MHFIYAAHGGSVFNIAGALYNKYLYSAAEFGLNPPCCKNLPNKIYLKNCCLNLHVKAWMAKIVTAILSLIMAAVEMGLS